MKRHIAVLLLIISMGHFSWAESDGNASTSQAQKKKIPVTGDDSTVGEVSSGGGSAIVCRDSKGTIIETPVVLDLYESQFNIPVASGSFSRDYLSAVKRYYSLRDLTPMGDNLLLNELEELLSLRHFTESDEKLILLDDIGRSLDHLKEGCSREQAAIYIDETEETEAVIYVDTEIWEAMDSINKAALMVHEKLYKLDRNLGETDSLAARQTVAYLFSTDQFAGALTGIPQEHRVCVTGFENDKRVLSKLSVFYIYPSQNGYTFQFSRLMGRPMLRKSTIFWEGELKLASFQDSGVLVIDPEAQETRVLPLEGSQYTGLSVEIDYNFNRTLKLSLYREGKLLEKAETTSCLRLN